MLDSGHKYRATVKKVIDGSKGPLPVVMIDVYPDSSTLPEARSAEAIRTSAPARLKAVDSSPAHAVPPRPGLLAGLWRLISGGR
jgi:hypothetical protein